jgi:serine/threonine protein kinase
MVHGLYTVVRKLAEGGMAEIFLARQHGSEGFEKPVVLKRIHSGFYADEQFRNMLVDEAHISMTLHHNNIVQVLDLGRSAGRLFLVLELVDGWDLSWIIERAEAAKRPIPIGLGLYVMVEVCRALAYAHGRTDVDGNPMGIVHRDVSPQNVLVSDQGEVKLADFGIAKALTKRDRTAAGVVKGKIAFMSPEQAKGQVIDARSDLFSLGTMLYLITTGVRPFEAVTDFEILARVQKGDFKPPEEVKPDFSMALAAVIKRTMTPDREQRYPTGEELLVDLEGIWRSEHGSPGQTELKLWLADLGRRDGVKTIGRTRFGSGTATDSGGLGEGDKVVLGDEGSDRRPRRSVSIGAVDTEGPSLEEETAVPLGQLETTERSLGQGHGHVLNRPPTRVARTGRGELPSVRVTGVEPTTMSDLALSLGDESADMMEHIHRGGQGRKVGVGLAIALAVGGGAMMFWKLESDRRANLEVDETRADSPAPAGASPAPAGGTALAPARPPQPTSSPSVPDRASAPPATRPPAAAAPAPGTVPPGDRRTPAVEPARPASRSGVDAARIRELRDREMRWKTPPGPIYSPGPRTPPPVETPSWQPPPQPVEEPPPVSPAPAPVGEDPATPAPVPPPASEPAPAPPLPAPTETPSTEPPPVAPVPPPASTEPPPSPN